MGLIPGYLLAPFVQNLSAPVALPELADVIVSDLRGVLPPFEGYLPAIIDARQRRPGGGQVESGVRHADYILILWCWDTQVVPQTSRTGCKANFRQSTFFATPLSPANLKFRAAEFVPALNEEGKVDSIALEMMASGQASVSSPHDWPRIFRTVSPIGSERSITSRIWRKSIAVVGRPGDGFLAGVKMIQLIRFGTVCDVAEKELPALRQRIRALAVYSRGRVDCHRLQQFSMADDSPIFFGIDTAIGFSLSIGRRTCYEEGSFLLLILWSL